jgi:hypothetical protein
MRRRRRSTEPTIGLDATLSRACQHPGNVWSLHGLHECLTRRGEMANAAHVKLQLDKALARAEVPIKASCFCRHRAAASPTAGDRRDPAPDPRGAIARLAGTGLHPQNGGWGNPSSIGMSNAVTM